MVAAACLGGNVADDTTTPTLTGSIVVTAHSYRLSPTLQPLFTHLLLMALAQPQCRNRREHQDNRHDFHAVHGIAGALFDQPHHGGADKTAQQAARVDESQPSRERGALESRSGVEKNDRLHDEEHHRRYTEAQQTDHRSRQRSDSQACGHGQQTRYQHLPGTRRGGKSRQCDRARCRRQPRQGGQQADLQGTQLAVFADDAGQEKDHRVDRDLVAEVDQDRQQNLRGQALLERVTTKACALMKTLLKIDLVLALEIEHFPRLIRGRHAPAQGFDHCANTLDLIGVGRGQFARPVPQRILKADAHMAAHRAHGPQRNLIATGAENRPLVSVAEQAVGRTAHVCQVLGMPANASAQTEQRCHPH